MKVVSSADLARETGQSVRAIQHMADLGILKGSPETEKRGRGNHRTFPAEPRYGERTWALIAGALSETRMPMSDMKIVMDLLREEDERGEGGPYRAVVDGREMLLLIGVENGTGALIPAAFDMDEPSTLRELVKFTRRCTASRFLHLGAILGPLTGRPKRRPTMDLPPENRAG